MDNGHRNRAIVLGASMAGLLAARVLADRYADVVVVDRDDLADHHCSGEHDHDCPRRSLPQNHHLHALLPRGQQTIEALLPGITDELIAAGAVHGDLTGNARWIVNGRRMPQSDSDLLLVSVSRPLLEQRVRARVRALPNVRLLERHRIAGLLTSGDNTAVAGVSVVANNTARALPGDLVVDATGRRSRTPAWLQDLGYPEVEEEHVKISVGYGTQYFRLPAGSMGNDVHIDTGALPPSLLRGAICARIDSGLTVVTAYGFLGDYPPGDSEGFLAFLKSLTAPDIYDTLRDHPPLAEPLTYRFPSNLRRRYEHMATLPDGLLMLGDAVCSFNPVYGQGMTVAALGAVVLRDHLARAGTPRPAEYFAELAEQALDDVWLITTGADLAFPEVEGVRPDGFADELAFMDRLLEAAQQDRALLTAYARVAVLVDPPDALAAPEIQAAVDAALDYPRVAP